MLYSIIDGIYLSNWHDATNMNLIKDKNIKIVIRLSADRNKNIYDNSIVFYNIELEDKFLYKDKIIEVADEIHKLINLSGENILIHCNEGQSRSVIVIIYYLMKQYKYSYGKAFNFIKNKKPDIRPNPVFVQELKKLSFN